MVSSIILAAGKPAFLAESFWVTSIRKTRHA